MCVCCLLFVFFCLLGVLVFCLSRLLVVCSLFVVMTVVVVQTRFQSEKKLVMLHTWKLYKQQVQVALGSNRGERERERESTPRASATSRATNGERFSTY